MNKISVNLDAPSPYIEKTTRFHRFKRALTYRFALSLIAKYAKNGVNSLLEIGTGSGYFLSSFHAKNPKTALTGLEYDERLLGETKNKVPFANCIQGNAEYFDFSMKNFDVVVSFQVIEHLYNPAAMLTLVRKHLKPGGIFLITSPNLDGFGARIMGNKWHAYRDDHVSLKGCKVWQELIEQHGFETLYSGSTFFSGVPFMNKFPIGIFNWMLLLVLGSAKWHRGESFVGVFIKK